MQLEKINRRFHNVYKNILQRCNNPTNRGYKHYGGRGIKCLWKNYREFENDMYISYFEAIYDGIKPTIERINNNGDYCKDNCRWATVKEQALNRRYLGRLGTNPSPYLEFATGIKIKKATFYQRKYLYGWTQEKAESTPVRQVVWRGKINFNGKSLTLREWAKELGIHPVTLIQRRRKGWPEDRIFSKKL